MKQPVVIGRFQVPQLTDGHKAFLRAVYKEFDRWPVVLLGVSPLPQTPNNPLTFDQRWAVIREDMSPIHDIYPLLDMPTDDLWSQQIDILLTTLLHGKTPVLCGGRDSFLPHYRGKFLTWECPLQNDLNHLLTWDESNYLSGTDHRKLVPAMTNSDFRRGAVWATQQQFPRVDSTVDLLVTRTDTRYPNIKELLIGQKADGRWVFPGGYIDVRETAEQAVAREALEELDLAVKDASLKLLGTHVVNDWRYRGEKRMSVLTHVFHCHSINDGMRAGDDLAAVKWVPVNQVRGHIIPAHQDIFDAFIERIL